MALALVLGDDPRLTALAKGYVDRRITLESTPSLTFGNASIMRFLMEYQEATGDPRIVPWMRRWYRRAGASVPNDGGWEYQGCHEHLVAAALALQSHGRPGPAGASPQHRRARKPCPGNVVRRGLHHVAWERGAEHRQHYGGIPAFAPAHHHHSRRRHGVANQIPGPILPATTGGTVPASGDRGDSATRQLFRSDRRPVRRARELPAAGDRSRSVSRHGTVPLGGIRLFSGATVRGSGQPGGRRPDRGPGLQYLARPDDGRHVVPSIRRAGQPGGRHRSRTRLG